MEEGALNKAAQSGLSSPEFFDLCVWLGSQIKSLGDMEESITSADEEYNECTSSVQNRVRFELLPILKKGLFFDPEFQMEQLYG